MAEDTTFSDVPHIVVRRDRPLIGIISPEGDGDTVTYFTAQESAEAATPDAEVEATLGLAGAWSDVPWDEIEAGLDEVRHASSPTPPIEL